MSKSLTITEVLMNLREGGSVEELAHEIRNAVRATRETGKKSSVTLKIDIAPNGREAVTITDTVVAKLPKPDAVSTMFYATEDDGLSRRDPRQPEIPGIEANR